MVSHAFSVRREKIEHHAATLHLCIESQVCVAILWDRRLLRQSENLFLLSLAVSDIGVSVLVMFFAAVNDIRQEWVFGSVYCKLWISFDITCCTASILNLCAICLDRYWHISAPMQYIQV